MSISEARMVFRILQVQMLDELAQDNSISAISKQTLLYYHQKLVLLSFFYHRVVKYSLTWQHTF